MFQYSMLRFPLTADGPRAARPLMLLAALATTLFAGFLATSAPRAEAKSSQLIELGAKNLRTFKPNCGRDFSRECKVEGKVTAFQSLSAKYRGRNFVVPFNGKMVAWSISLANPTRTVVEHDGNKMDAQLPAFNEIFGPPAKAGISILRQVEKRKKGAPRYKLVRRSPIKILNPYFGTKVTFALETPLNVYKNNIVALTIPTWAPALWTPRTCNELGDDVVDPVACERAQARYTFRGSRVPRGEDEPSCVLGRDPSTFEPNEALKKTAPQTKIDSVRRYGCYYGGNVLLYSAIIVGR